MTESPTLTLKGGQLVLIDAQDHARLQGHLYRKSGGDIIRTLRRPDAQGRVTRTLKHDVLGRTDLAIGFVNGNPLDHRRANLRVVRDPKKSHTAQFDKLQVKPRKEATYTGRTKFHSEVVGVTFRQDRAGAKPWRVRIQVGGKPLYLGHFATQAEAEAVSLAAYGKGTGGA